MLLAAPANPRELHNQDVVIVYSLWGPCVRGCFRNHLSGDVLKMEHMRRVEWKQQVSVTMWRPSSRSQVEKHGSTHIWSVSDRRNGMSGSMNMNFNVVCCEFKGLCVQTVKFFRSTSWLFVDAWVKSAEVEQVSLFRAKPSLFSSLRAHINRFARCYSEVGTSCAQVKFKHEGRCWKQRAKLWLHTFRLWARGCCLVLIFSQNIWVLWSLQTHCDNITNSASMLVHFNPLSSWNKVK